MKYKYLIKKLIISEKKTKIFVKNIFIIIIFYYAFFSFFNENIHFKFIL